MKISNEEFERVYGVFRTSAGDYRSSLRAAIEAISEPGVREDLDVLWHFVETIAQDGRGIYVDIRDVQNAAVEAVRARDLHRSR